MKFSIVFCAKCGSHEVDVRSWQTPTSVRLECYGCGHNAVIEGFSLGRVLSEGPMTMDRCLAEARTDVARWEGPTT
jgi:hypothetical protein